MIWILENSAGLKDLGVLVFSGVGAFFAYRSWRQKNDEIKEKYFERRYALYISVTEAVSIGLHGNSISEWWRPLLEAKQKSEFLFGAEVQVAIGEIHHLLNEHYNLISNDDVATRAKSAETRKLIGNRLREAEIFMKRYLTIV